MNTKMMIEIFGYVGSFLVVFSMLMSSVVKLRIINTLGSIVSGTYALIIGSFPLALMNGCLIIINIYNLFKLRKMDKTVYDIVDGDAGEAYFQYFINHYLADIKSFFPYFDEKGALGDAAYIVCCNENPAGIFLGSKQENGTVDIILDYSTPTYRDCSVGQYLYQELPKYGVKQLIFKDKAEKHEGYLQKMGYVNQGGRYVKNL